MKLKNRVLLCCTVGYKWVTVIDGIKSEFNDMISLYTINDSNLTNHQSRIFYSLYYIYYIVLFRKKKFNNGGTCKINSKLIKSHSLYTLITQ